MPDSAAPTPPEPKRPVAAARPSATLAEPRWPERLLRVLTVLALLYLFFLGLDLMGLSFKLFGKGFAERLLTGTSDPFVGLVVGILATSLVQSSSTTTSMTVALVAAGGISLEGAIPIIMGANIGTSVTNTLVSLGHVTRREEFRRAFAGATLHDFFNLLTVAILFPLELATHYLARTALAIETFLEGSGGLKLFDPVKAIVRPVAHWISTLLGSSGWLTLLAGIALLFLALRFLVGVLKDLLTARAEEILDRTLLRSPLAAVGAGLAITAMVQSSSITTSVMVPLVAAGIVSLEQLFPLTIGANLGTTVTAMLAALSTGNAAAISVALSHVLFNATGAVALYPIPLVRRIPLALARGLGAVASRHRWLALLYVAFVFFGVPLLMLAVAGRF